MPEARSYRVSQFLYLDPDVRQQYVAPPEVFQRRLAGLEQAATTNKLANTDHNPGLADINATFSSSHPDWYFGTGDSTPINKIDFVSVVLHELGHGLGFWRWHQRHRAGGFS
jgi:hypothetical protein